MLALVRCCKIICTHVCLQTVCQAKLGTLAQPCNELLLVVQAQRIQKHIQIGAAQDLVNPMLRDSHSVVCDSPLEQQYPLLI